MTQKINIDGIEHGLDTLSDDEKKLVARLQDTDACIHEMKNLLAIFTRAKRSYIAELKREIIKGKSGVDIASLFD
jgi:thioredoxin-related protein